MNLPKSFLKTKEGDGTKVVTIMLLPLVLNKVTSFASFISCGIKHSPQHDDMT